MKRASSEKPSDDAKIVFMMINAVTASQALILSDTKYERKTNDKYLNKRVLHNTLFNIVIYNYTSKLSVVCYLIYNPKCSYVQTDWKTFLFSNFLYN